MGWGARPHCGAPCSSGVGWGGGGVGHFGVSYLSAAEQGAIIKHAHQLTHTQLFLHGSCSLQVLVADDLPSLDCIVTLPSVSGATSGGGGGGSGGGAEAVGSV